MQSLAIIAGYYLLMFLSAALAYKEGRRADRLGALWCAGNVIVGGIFSIIGLTSPTAHLVSDGIFAVGLLPLAVIFASYWIGLVTLVAAALFSLEAVYLINDWTIDTTYMIANNALWVATPLILLISGCVNLRRRKRQASPQGGGDATLAPA